MTCIGPARAARSPAASSSPARGAPAARRTAPPRRLLGVVALVALVALIGAGCSAAPAEAGRGGDRDAAAGAAPSSAELPEKLPEYARCVRENGVPDPDPGANGVIEYYGVPDPQVFRSATERCDDVLPADRGGNR